MSLTKKQGMALGVIVDYIKEFHFPPSTDEVSLLMGFKSRGGARCHLQKLIEKGYIRRKVGARRGITLCG